MKPVKFAVTSMLFSLLPLSVAHADGAALYASKACIACHGAEGKSPISDVTPKLAGQNKGYLIQQLEDIKSGARSNGRVGQMKGIVSGMSDDEFEAISEYLSGL